MTIGGDFLRLKLVNRSSKRCWQFQRSTPSACEINVFRVTRSQVREAVLVDHMSAALEEEALTDADSQARRIEALRIQALAVAAPRPSPHSNPRPPERCTAPS
jgi:hypothetical protein